MFCARHTIGSENCFGRIGWYHLVTGLKWNLVSVLSDIVLILMQDSCMVCVELTIVSDSILDAPN